MTMQQINSLILNICGALCIVFFTIGDATSQESYDAQLSVKQEDVEHLINQIKQSVAFEHKNKSIKPGYKNATGNKIVDKIDPNNTGAAIFVNGHFAATPGGKLIAGGVDGRSVSLVLRRDGKPWGDGIVAGKEISAIQVPIKAYSSDDNKSDWILCKDCVNIMSKSGSVDKIKSLGIDLSEATTIIYKAGITGPNDGIPVRRTILISSVPDGAIVTINGARQSFPTDREYSVPAAVEINVSLKYLDTVRTFKVGPDKSRVHHVFDEE